MVRFAEDDTYGGQDTYAGQEAAYGGQQDAYGGQDWAQEGAYDEAAYTQPADEAGGAYGADAAYSQHVADDANDYGGQNTAASDDAVYDPAYAEEDYGDLDLDAGETRFPELEAAAASHLQACERGRAARKRHKATMEARSKTKSATALQARVRGRNERRKDRDFMRTPNAKAASPDPRTPGGGLTGDSLPDINNAAAPDPRTPGGGLKAETESPPSVRFAAEPQLDDAPSEFRARRPPTPLPQLGAMNYDDEDDDDDDEIEEDAAIATPRRDDSRPPEVDRDDVDADPSPISVIESPPVRRSRGLLSRSTEAHRATSPPTTSRRGGSRGAELASASPRLSRGARRVLRPPPTHRRHAAKRASRPPTRRHRARHASLRSPRPLDERASPPTRRLRLGSRARRRPNRRPRTRLQDEPGLVRVKRASLALHHRARPRLRAVLGSQRARTRRRAGASAGLASPRRRPSRRRRATMTRGRGASAERAARHRVPSAARRIEPPPDVRTARDAAGLAGGGRAGRAKESRPARRRRRHGL